MLRYVKKPSSEPVAVKGTFFITFLVIERMGIKQAISFLIYFSI